MSHKSTLSLGANECEYWLFLGFVANSKGKNDFGQCENGFLVAFLFPHLPHPQQNLNKKWHAKSTQNVPLLQNERFFFISFLVSWIIFNTFLPFFFLNDRPFPKWKCPLKLKQNTLFPFFQFFSPFFMSKYAPSSTWICGQYLSPKTYFFRLMLFSLIEKMYSLIEKMYCSVLIL